MSLPFPDLPTCQDKQGYIYLMESAGLYKIGFSGWSLTRLAQFETGNPSIRLCADWAVFDRSIELRLHSYFGPAVTGEWFALSPAEAAALTLLDDRTLMSLDKAISDQGLSREDFLTWSSESSDVRFLRDGIFRWFVFCGGDMWFEFFSRGDKPTRTDLFELWKNDPGAVMANSYFYAAVGHPKGTILQAFSLIGRPQ